MGPRGRCSRGPSFQRLSDSVTGAYLPRRSRSGRHPSRLRPRTAVSNTFAIADSIRGSGL